MPLSKDFDNALVYASEQVRKGSGVPYIAHLMSLSSKVLVAGGTEIQAIAGLLHDAAEDQGGKATLDDIQDRFGPHVAQIVADCTDSWVEPKPEWRPRKEAYLSALPAKPTASLLVSLADKVDNAEAILNDYLRFLAALGNGRPNALFFAGDLGQRIFQQPFSWKALGVDIRGRSRTLRVNYRTSHQIRTQADRLLGPVVTDVDGNSDDRTDTVSVFNGPPPTIHSLKSESDEVKTVGNWIVERAKAGVLPHEFGVFVRSTDQLDRAQAAVKRAGVAFKVLDENVETTSGHISIGTMHLAKGLEFRALAVMACDDEIIPLQERIEMVGDDADLQEVYDTERHLLYVACTRARDYLLVTGVAPVSEFLDDFTKANLDKRAVF